MAKKKKSEALNKAISKNKARAADKEKQRLDDVDRMWRTYAKALLGESLTANEKAELPGIMESLGIEPEQVTADLASIEKLQQYEAVLAQRPVASLAELRAQRDRAAEEYERLRRLVNTTNSYQTRKLDMETRVAAIRHSRPQLWVHLDRLLPPAVPGVEPTPRERARIISLFSRKRASSPPVEAADDAEPERAEYTEQVEHEPDPALAANIDVPDAQAEPGIGVGWPRPIERRFKRGEPLQ